MWLKKFFFNQIKQNILSKKARGGSVAFCCFVFVFKYCIFIQIIITQSFYNILNWHHGVYVTSQLKADAFISKNIQHV